MIEEKQYIDTGKSLKKAEQSQMFGKPCFKMNGKAFCCFFENSMVFKLSGDDHAEAMNLKGSKLFDPSGKGRAMKEWVQVTYVHYKKWDKFAKSAAEYVG
ncbi:MAG TPA: hypothetical protein VFG10_05535 [Saprospiraceae bacterium]|nr:hypothetical protein [Saprospiraceae bacterium]